MSVRYGGYVEPGGSWRPFWVITGFLVLLLGLDLALPGGDVPALVWVLAFLVVLGIVGGGALSARRVWTVRIDAAGPDPSLSVGRERIALADVDGAHLRAVRDGEAGADAGAPVLGGGWSVPKGRTGLPLRLADGRTVLVPTRHPSDLLGALIAVTGRTAEGDSGSSRTLGS